MSVFSDWLAGFVDFSASGTSVSAVVGLGAMIGVAVAILKHFRGSDYQKPGHWLILSYDIWNVAALSLAVTVTVLVGQNVYLANSRLVSLADALVINATNQELADRIAALETDLAGAQARLNRYVCIDAVTADSDGWQDICSEQAQMVQMLLAATGTDFGPNQIAQLEEWLTGSVAALIVN
ncbi:hypothetical protein PANO111632_20760 [Paracoccus nototheniae]